MTQSGQGDEQQLPAVRPAHEGVVLPAGGGEPWIPGGPADQAAPAGGQPWGQPWGPQAAHPDASSQQPQQQSQPYQPQPHQQPQQQAHGSGQGAYGQAQYGAGQQPPPGYGQQQPVQQPQPAQQYGQMPQAQPQPQAPQPPHAQPLPPMQPQPSAQQQPQPPQSFAQPLPPEVVPGGPGGPGGVPGGDEAATQYIAPVPAGPAPGGLPPQQPPQQQYQQQQQQPGQGSDAEATQYIPPVPGGTPYGIRPGAPGDRQPPAEFDNLFRNDEPVGSTQQMPLPDPARQPQRHQQPQQPQQPQHHQYAGDRQPPNRPVAEDPYEPQPRKRRAHVTLIAAVVAGCAVVGLGAGALLSGGDKGDEGKEPVGSASTPAVQQSASPEAEVDPAKPQAEALDKLLADSNNSRAAVIGAVEKTKKCTDLDQAVADLKDAAQQRRDLVTRLQELSVDKLPNNAQLTASLTKAWQASASADDHYAAWAAQAKNGKKVCKHGKARTTTETQKATVQSGEASRAKQQAAGLWNSIASKYGLTRRTATQL
ncbi:hypothetical protein [Streptomyces sp. NPDC014685]|uniref:hypothetical protein n=1 Tax=Streptomyces sp. NPDC014685 TaxID=3364881 RepID=UPI0036FEEA92